MKELIENEGKFNDWKGCIGLYFTKKQLRQIAKEIKVPYREIECLKIKEVYNLYLVRS